VRLIEVGAPEDRIMAEAVLTPRYNDLEIATRTEAAPLTSGIIALRIAKKSDI
jgi:hypothetical protein